MFPILLSLVLRSVLEVSHLLQLAPATSSHVVSLSSKQFLSHQPCAFVLGGSGLGPLQRDWRT